VSPHGVGVGDVPEGSEPLHVLGVLLVGQLNPPTHEVDENVEAVLLLEARVEGTAVLSSHLVTLAPHQFRCRVTKL
jgi:hypothetical protein